MCTPDLLLSHLFAPFFTPSIPVLALRQPRPFCPPLSLSQVALILSSVFFSSLCLIVSLLYSVLTSLLRFIKALPSFHSTISYSPRRLLFFPPFTVPCSLPPTQPQACYRSCTCWTSGEHIRVCIKHVHVCTQAH